MSDFSTRRVPGLDLVRSAAILGVVVSHYWPCYERFSTAASLKSVAHPIFYAWVSSLFGEFRGLTFIVAGLDLAAVYVFSAAVYHLWEAPMTHIRERFSSSPTTTHISSTTELVVSND